ncbi:MAG TPA: DUF4157 domain-containing protein [Pyrinomonadaceae bacterium]|jgi:hypothetical protein|nr:DUF4157 domain-containing protein [Pyrinomonadaceae bacterium]
MKLAAESQQLIEAFLRERFRLATLKLPPVFIYHGGVAHFLTKTFHIGAITFGRHIFVAPKLLTRDGDGKLCVPGWLIAHESTHVLQYQREGFIGFLISYLKGYWRALRMEKSWNGEARMKAYLAIKEECDARESETAYAVWVVTFHRHP